MIAQIYGITTVDDGVMVAELGADHIGLVPEIGPDNWDGVTPDEANTIMAAVPAGVTRVVLSLGTDVATVVATAQNVPTDVLHVVRTDVLDNDDLRAIGDETGIPLMATVAVDGPGAVAAAQQLATVADVLLLDSRHPSSGVVGASGHTHDWALSAAVVRSVDVPVILAGGLGPDNVGAAIEQVAPWGVDSETHTSFPDDRRRKDPDRVRRFLERARSARAHS